ncbi:MAG: Gfo/Idh/MocA family protein [Planctomycetota bacterium]
MHAAISRRDFLLAAGCSVALPRLASARGYPANERIGLGLIGVGGLGGGFHLPKVLRIEDLEVLAVADVDAEHLDKAVAKTGGRASGYRDYRRILERSDIDAVLIATPDHWHALCAVHAMEAGKDVYCEKPLALTIKEGRAIARAARSSGRVFQTGTQQRSDRRFRRASELVRNGRLGSLEEVRVVLGKAPTSAWVADSEAPACLDWNFWLGPAPLVPYNRKRCHYTFRWFLDYSGGKMTDWGAHHLDIVQWALGTELGGPVRVEASGVFPADNFYETAVDFDVRYEYANGVRVRVAGSGRNGVTFRGSAGELFVSRSEIRATPAEILDSEAGPIRLYESRDHHRNWIDCIRSRRPPVSDAEIGHRSATVCHLGNIAMALGRKLVWDPAAERFPEDEAANRLLHKPMRSPWTL